jgi:hypothetical protein
MIRNGRISLETHGPGPQRGAPILATGQPESGNSLSESPRQPMWNDKIGMFFPGMQPFFGMLKKTNLRVLILHVDKLIFKLDES